MLTLNDGRKELYQWDTGRTASVNVECDKVHFSNLLYGSAFVCEVVDGTVRIPDELLTSGENVHFWTFIGKAEDGFTKKNGMFAVNKRPKPSDYTFTPTELISIETVDKKIGNLEELPTENKVNLVGAINELFGSGGGGSGGGLTEDEVKEIVENETADKTTEDKVKEIVATETEGKFTPSFNLSIPQALGDGHIVTYNTDGKTVQRRMISGAYAGAGTIPYRGTNGVIYVGDATANAHATTFKQLKEYTAPIADHEKRIENLESTLLTYVEDTASAYEKAVPVGVGKYAILSSIGGASYTSKNAFNPALLNGSNYTITDDGGILYLKDVVIDGVPPSEEVDITLNAGTWYISASGEGNVPSSFEVYDENHSPIVAYPITLETRKTISLRWYYEVEGIWEKPFYIMLSQTENAPYEPYFEGLRNAPTTEVISKDTKGEVLQNIPIPTQIQALAHYGEAYTYIDFDDKQFIDEGDTIVFTGDESFRYYYYNGNGIDVYNICKNGKDNVSNFISTEGNKRGSGYGAGNMWCGYQKGTGFHWIGILDILGYTNDWVDKAKPTNEEKANALAKFKQYVKDRYNSGNPITVRYEILNPVITDVSAYLTDYTDYKKIRVEANGTIVCENIYEYAVPSTITYVKRKG